MLSEQAVEPRTLELINRLMQDKNLNDFVLVGGPEGIKVDFIKHAYDNVKPVIIQSSVRMAGLEDIAAMKLNAIAGSGKRLKDFVDIAYLSSFLTFKEMMQSFDRKYKVSNPVMILKSLSYYEDIDFTQPVNLLKGWLDWNRIKDRIQSMIRQPNQLFDML